MMPHSFWGWVGFIIYALVDFLLGKSDRFYANSVLELITDLIKPKGTLIMSNVPITLNIPSEEKDAADAIILAINDFKAKKGTAIIADELPSFIKLMGEISPLMADLKTKGSIVALEYIANSFLGV